MSYWLKMFLACNPFFLVSAPLLLYGLYLVSADANFPGRESAQLLWNFGSLQLYELLLVATAILLARRRIWYDSVLLAGLEGMLVLVPFILLNQAALLGPLQALDRRMFWGICLAGGTAAILRFGSLKLFFKELNLPNRLLGFGLVLLLVNIALPLIYRHFEETRLGARTTDGAAYEMNRYSWLLLLPALFALFNLMPRPRQLGNLLSQRRWLPAGLLAVWLVVSGVHLYSLGYVYDLPFEFIFAVPLAWTVMWLAYLRHHDLVARRVLSLQKFLLVPPAVVTLFAMTRSGRVVFLVLTALNIACYGFLAIRGEARRVAFHLLLISFVALAAGLAVTFEPRLPAELNSARITLLAICAYLMFWVARSRDPKFALLGLVVVAIASLQLFDDKDFAWSLAIQSSLVFLLAHSLRWNDLEHDGAAALRFFGCAAWALHSLVLVHARWEHAMPMVYGAGAFLLAAYLFKRLLSHDWRPLAVPIAACIVLLAQPCDFVGGKLRLIPTGLQVVMGSFLLFGLGTLAALTRSRWHHSISHEAVTVATKPIDPNP